MSRSSGERSHAEQTPAAMMSLQEVSKKIGTPKHTRVCSLLMGINKYEYEKPLSNCAKDVALLERKMRDAETYDREFYIHTLVASEDFVMKSHIDKALIDFGRYVSDLNPKPEIVIFYFAGHGKRWDDDKKGETLDNILASDVSLWHLRVGRE